MEMEQHAIVAAIPTNADRLHLDLISIQVSDAYRAAFKSVHNRVVRKLPHIRTSMHSALIIIVIQENSLALLQTLYPHFVRNDTDFPSLVHGDLTDLRHSLHNDAAQPNAAELEDALRSNVLEAYIKCQISQPCLPNAKNKGRVLLNLGLWIKKNPFPTMATTPV